MVVRQQLTEQEIQDDSNRSARDARERSKAMRAEIFKHGEKRREVNPMYLKPWQAFTAFALVNAFAAIYAPIQDCDEVFNFWEPTHYLGHGYGFETWEYSPEFAIRTWLYPGLHAMVAFLGLPGTYLFTKTFQFYFLRFALGLFCAGAQSRFYAQVSRTLNDKIGLFLAMIMIVSPGMFHASVAFLPSSFTMYTTMYAMASFLDWRGGPQTPQGIFWMGLGSILAWPFVGALVLPFLAEEAILSIYTGAWRDMGIRFLYGTTRTAVTGAVEFFVDLCFYRKYVFFPLNIVWYNVVAATQGKGPNIYGTEPWHFYIRNLLINFNLWFVLAILAAPLLFYQEFIYRRPATKSSYIRNFIFVSPLYIWLAIFTIQPHKEERFMYSVYPCIALNAAISLHISLIHLSSRGGGSSVMNIIPARLRLLLVGGILLAAALLGASRTVGNIEAYGAPLSVYKPLHEPGATHPSDTVCHGKEWYRFPSSYHLPDGVKGKFVRSAFKGLLPGEFHEAKSGFGLFPGAWLIPPGMNDMNKEDVGKYTLEHHCTFFVDSSLPGVTPSGLEPDRVHDDSTWEQVRCERFLDAASTGTLARLMWVPDWEIIPARFRRKWGKYCLLKRRGSRYKIEDLYE